jgi:hypothetical protein
MTNRYIEVLVTTGNFSAGSMKEGTFTLNFPYVDQVIHST